jgi:hypothetical protein
MTPQMGQMSTRLTFHEILPRMTCQVRVLSQAPCLKLSLRRWPAQHNQGERHTSQADDQSAREC